MSGYMAIAWQVSGMMKNMDPEQMKSMAKMAQQMQGMGGMPGMPGMGGGDAGGGDTSGGKMPDLSNMSMDQGMEMMENMNPDMMKAGMEMMKNMDPKAMAEMSKVRHKYSKVGPCAVISTKHVCVCSSAVVQGVYQLCSVPVVRKRR